MPRELTRRRPARDTSAYTAPAKETEDEKPARRGRRTEASAPTPAAKHSVQKGWGSYKKTVEATKGSYGEDFKPRDNEAELIKILDDGPFAVFKQHWIDAMPKGKKKSYPCLKDEDGEGYCPLCDDLGDAPRAQGWVNVVNLLEDPEKQEVLIWKVGTFVGDVLENAANEDRTSPINRLDLYWEVKKNVKNNKTTYSVSPVKARDLKDDWGIDPLTEEEHSEFEADGYDDSEVYFPSVADLKEVVSIVGE